MVTYSRYTSVASKSTYWTVVGTVGAKVGHSQWGPDGFLRDFWGETFSNVLAFQRPLAFEKDSLSVTERREPIFSRNC